MSEPIGERPEMPGYGVDTPRWQALPWEWARARLAPARNYWLVTVSGGGRPHALPVWGVWDDHEHRFAFACDPRSRKARNLVVNPRVTFTVESTIEALSVEGAAGVVESTARQEQWIERYIAKYRALEAAVEADFLRQNLIVEVVPDRAFAIIERDDEFSTRATRWRFR